MKKICIVTTVWSSIDNWFRPIFEDYEKLGVDVTVVCNMDRDYEKLLNENYPSIHTKSLPFPRGISIQGSVRSIHLLTKFFKEQKFDYVQYHTPNAALYGSIAGKTAKIPIRIYGQWGIRYVSVHGIKRIILKNLERLTCLVSTHVRAQSPKNMQFNISEKLCKPGKISVIGIGGTIGVDFHEFDISKKHEYRVEIRNKLNLDDQEFVFGYIGRLHRDKGINELIKAFQQVKNARLLLVGDLDSIYPPESENLDFINTSDRVIITARIPHRDIPKYLSCMDILVHPTYREGFGHILQESQTMGIPTITTDIPGPSEVIENDISGILVPVANSEELYKEMEKLMHDRGRRERYAEVGRQRAKKYFEKSIMVKNIMDDYRTILNL